MPAGVVRWKATLLTRWYVRVARTLGIGPYSYRGQYEREFRRYKRAYMKWVTRGNKRVPMPLPPPLPNPE